jgi:hypothetical protein
MAALIPSRPLDLQSSATEVLRPTDHQQTQIVCPAVPLTPPLSPKPGQNIGNIDSMTIDDECTAINPDQSENDEMKDPSNIIPLSTLMVVDPEPLEADSPVHPPPRPQRLLEDEKVHLQRSGIKLADFEVRGTLGMDLG